MLFLSPVMGLPLTTPAPVVNLRDPFETAAKRANVTLDCCARMMGISPQLLDQQLDCAGNNHLSMRRVFLLSTDPRGRAFLKEFFPLAAGACGIPELADALRLAEVFSSFVNRAQVTMAKADLHAPAQEKRTA